MPHQATPTNFVSNNRRVKKLSILHKSHKYKATLIHTGRQVYAVYTGFSQERADELNHALDLINANIQNASTINLSDVLPTWSAYIRH